MNVTIPYSWIKEFVQTKAGAEETARALTLHGPTVEKILNIEGESVFDLEVTTNRPDLMSVVGLAREVKAALGGKFYDPFHSPLSLRGAQRRGNLNSKLSVQIKEPKLCSRYLGIVMDNVRISPSPQWMQKRLTQAGIRPLNNVIDATNYVMLAMGQPLHAFDLDKIESISSKSQITNYKQILNSKSKIPKIIIRKAKRGEKLLALDGKEYKLDSNMLVIADAKKPVALAGIMGGEETGITPKTERIILEAATFDPVSIRKTSHKLALFSDSQARFEKGLSVISPEYAMGHLVEVIQKLAGGETASKLIDKKTKAYRPKSVSCGYELLEQYLGASISKSRISKILSVLGFKVKLEKKKFTAEVPWWRNRDISIAEDLIEEVTRFYGYHNIKGILPQGEIPVSEMDKLIKLEGQVKNILVGTGFDEIYSYSFVSEKLLRAADFKPEKTVKISNPLTSDFEYMRPSLIPSLLEAAAKNQENFSSGRIFEIARVYKPLDKGLPEEKPRLTFLVWGKSKNGKLFFDAKGVLEYLFDRLGAKLELEKSITRRPAIWHPGRSVSVLADGKILGTLSEVHPQVCVRFNLEKDVALVDLDFTLLAECVTAEKTYQSIPEYPPVKRDLSMIVDQKTEYGKIVKTIKSVDKLIYNAELFDIYQGKGVEEGKKSMAFHINYLAKDRTLKDKEVDEIEKKLIGKLEGELGAKVRTKSS